MAFHCKRAVLRALVSLAVAIIGSIGATAPVGAQTGTVDSITIKWRDDILPQGASNIPDALRTALANSLRIDTVVVGRNRDGGFRLQLSPPQSIAVARAAINRVRTSLPVIYVNLLEASNGGQTGAAQPAIGPGQQPPVTNLIVKYRDATLTQTSVQNGVLGQRSWQS